MSVGGFLENRLYSVSSRAIFLEHFSPEETKSTLLALELVCKMGRQLIDETIAKLSKEAMENQVKGFKLLKTLGEGSFGRCFLVQKMLGSDKGNHYAMKVNIVNAIVV